MRRPIKNKIGKSGDWNTGMLVNRHGIKTGGLEDWKARNDKDGVDRQVEMPTARELAGKAPQGCQSFSRLTWRLTTNHQDTQGEIRTVNEIDMGIL